MPRLESEITRLKKTEPQIIVGCRDGDGREIKKLEIEVPHYLPLREDEVLDLMKRIRDLVPDSDRLWLIGGNSLATFATHLRAR